MIWVHEVTLQRISLSWIYKTIARNEFSAAIGSAVFVQHNQTATVSPAERSVYPHPVVPKVNSDVVRSEPLELKGHIVCTETIQTRWTLIANLINHTAAIAIAEGDAPHEIIAKRPRKSAVVFFGAEITVNGFERALEHISRLFVKDVNCTTHGVSAVKSALRAAKDLNSLNIPKGLPSSGQQVFRINTVHVGCDTWITT